MFIGSATYDPKNAEANYQSATLLLNKAIPGFARPHFYDSRKKAKTSAQALSILCATTLAGDRETG